MFLIDQKQDKESEKIVKCLLLEILMNSNASWMALASAVKNDASLGRRAQKISFLFTAETATLP
jgi:hypothetical protein